MSIVGERWLTGRTTKTNAPIRRSSPMIPMGRDRARRMGGGLLLLLGATRANSVFIFVAV